MSARKIFLIVLGVTVLVWTAALVYILKPIKKPPLAPPKTATQAPTQTPLTSESKNLEDLARDYQVAYASQSGKMPPSEFLKDFETLIFDLRSEEDYLAGHIRHSSITTIENMALMAEEGKFEDKVIVILTNTGETQELKDLVGEIEKFGAKEIYLEANFKPDNFSQEMIERVEMPPPRSF